MNKPRILCFVSAYLPGFKAGGPMRSISNLVEHLGDEYQFLIITSDRDRGENRAYTGIVADKWYKVGKANVLYTNPASLTLIKVKELLISTPHELLYLNSFFNPKFTILPLIIRKLIVAASCPVLIAPRGEFSQGALAIKPFKKKLFLFFSRLVGLHKDANWQATTVYDANDIKGTLKVNAEKIHIAQNLPRKMDNSQSLVAKTSGEPLRIAFLSRIVPMKNLSYALTVLAHVKSSVTLYIYGPNEDQAYKEECESIIQKLPTHVNVVWGGSVPSEEVISTITDKDLFFLPTKGENYGHVIIEALQAGLPVLISDRTPWKDLVLHGVGSDLPLDQPERFVDFIEHMASLSIAEHAAIRRKSIEFAESQMSADDTLNENRAMFNAMIGVTGQ